MKKIYIPNFIGFFYIWCGFKVINKSELGNFDIAKLTQPEKKE